MDLSERISAAKAEATYQANQIARLARDPEDDDGRIGRIVGISFQLDKLEGDAAEMTTRHEDLRSSICPWSNLEAQSIEMVIKEIDRKVSLVEEELKRFYA